MDYFYTGSLVKENTMNTNDMIYELRRLAAIESEKPHPTFSIRWDYLCRDVADRLEELQEYKAKYEALCGKD